MALSLVYCMFFFCRCNINIAIEPPTKLLAFGASHLRFRRLNRALHLTKVSGCYADLSHFLKHPLVCHIIDVDSNNQDQNVSLFI